MTQTTEETATEETAAEEKINETRTPVHAVAEVSTGQRKENVVCADLTMQGCTLRLTFPVNPKTILVIRLFGPQGSEGVLELYQPIMVTVKWFRPSKTDPKVFYANVKYNQMVRADQGVAKLLYPERFVKKDNPRTVATQNKSVRGSVVTCHVCSHPNFAYFSLRTKSMNTRPNIFGIPIYMKPMEGMDYIDFNYLLVNVCPNCFFAYNEINFFQRNIEEELTPCPFACGPFFKVWKDTIAEREVFVQPNRDTFFSEFRSLEQAIQSYQLGILTADKLYELEENSDYVRKAASYLIFQAELLIRIGNRERADQNLNEAFERLNKVFFHIRGEASARCAVLLGMIKLYFKDYGVVNQYLSFLRNYDNQGKLARGSKEYQAVFSATEKLNNAYQDKELYDHEQLKNYQLK